MFNPNEILDAAGIKLAPGQSSEEVIQKILNDNFVQKKVFELLVKNHAAQAIAPCLPIEKDALGKRAGVQPAPTKAPVEWFIIPAEASTTGKLQIKAKCGAEEIFWNGGVANLKTFRYRGELVPAEIAVVYQSYYGGDGDPEWLAARNDYLRLEEAKRKKVMNDERQRNAGF